MLLNRTPLTVSLLQQAIQAFPADDSRVGHFHHVLRRCCQMSLRVWATPSADTDSTVRAAGAAEAAAVEYESDLLSLIAQLTEEGNALGMMFYVVLHYFAFVIDFRPEVPLSVHEAMLGLLLRYHQRFSYNAWDIEIKRVQATVLLLRLSQGKRDGDGQTVRDIERLLDEGMALAHYEKMRLLKLHLTRAQLALVTGDVGDAALRLRAALADLPEVQGSESFHGRRALELLRAMEFVQARSD